MLQPRIKNSNKKLVGWNNEFFSLLNPFFMPQIHFFEPLSQEELFSLITSFSRSNGLAHS